MSRHILRSRPRSLEARGFCPSRSPSPNSGPSVPPRSSPFDPSSSSSSSSDNDADDTNDLADLQLRLQNTERALENCEKKLKKPNPQHPKIPPNNLPTNPPRTQAQCSENNTQANVPGQGKTYILTPEDFINFNKTPLSDRDHVGSRSQSDGAIPPTTSQRRRRSSGLENLDDIPKELKRLEDIPTLAATQQEPRSIKTRLIPHVQTVQNCIQAKIATVPEIIDNWKVSAREYGSTAWERIRYPLEMFAYCLKYIFVHLTVEIRRFSVRTFFFLLPYIGLVYLIVAILYLILYVIRETSSSSVIFGIATFPVVTPASFLLCMVPGVRRFDAYSICPSPSKETPPPSYDNASSNSNTHNHKGRPNARSKPEPGKPTVEESELIARFEYLISPSFWEDSLGHAHGLEALGHNLQLARTPYETLYHTWKWTVDPDLQQRRAHVLEPLQNVAGCLDEEAEALIFFHGKVVSAYMNIEVTLGHFRDKLNLLLVERSGVWGWPGGGGGHRKDKEKLKADYIHFATAIITEIDELIAHINAIITLTGRTDASFNSLRKALYELELARQQSWDAQSRWVKFWWGMKGSQWSSEGREVGGMIEGHTDMIASLGRVRDMLKNRRSDWREFKGILGCGAIGSKIAGKPSSTLPFSSSLSSPSANPGSGSSTSSASGGGEAALDKQRILDPANERISFELHFKLADRAWLEYKLRVREAWKSSKKGGSGFGEEDGIWNRGDEIGSGKRERQGQWIENR